MLIMDEAFGDEWWEWDPYTVELEIGSEFQIHTLHAITYDRLMAGRLLRTSNMFYKDEGAFCLVCNVLSGDGGAEAAGPAEAHEVLWGILESQYIYEPDDDPDDTEFSPAVQRYTQEVLAAEGVASPTDIIQLGLRQGLAASYAGEDFSDDPGMATAISQVQGEKVQELIYDAIARLDMLLSQLTKLRLFELNVQPIQAIALQTRDALSRSLER